MASKKCYVWLRKLISLFENYGIAGWLSIKFLCVTLWHMSIASVNIGSLQVSPSELFRGLFIERIENVAAIYDLRFPRIVISLFAGAAVAVSGVLFQAVLKNPLADPGIIGISSGASFVAVLVTAFLPSLYFFTPLFAFAGGVLAFFLVYSLSWKGGVKPLEDHPDRCGGERYVRRTFRCAELDDGRKLFGGGLHRGGKYHTEDMERCADTPALCDHRADPCHSVFEDVQPDVTGGQDGAGTGREREPDADRDLPDRGAPGEHFYSGGGSHQFPWADRTAYRPHPGGKRPPRADPVFHAGRSLYLPACRYHRQDGGGALRGVRIHHHERDRRAVLYHSVKEVEE